MRTRKQLITKAISDIKESILAQKINIEVISELKEPNWETEVSKKEVEIKLVEKKLKALEKLNK